jgi:chloride channel protein, CIC family
MIVSVAISIGIRRLLSRENIYTIKLMSRRHFIPKALHANMFLVQQAADVMDRDVMLLPSEMSLDAFVRIPQHDGRVRHVVVTRDEEVVGVVRINTALHHGLEGTYTGVSLADVASRNFAIVDPEEIMFGVIGRMWKNGDTMAVVSRGNGVIEADQVLGVITKEHVADSVAASVRPYT